jgi:hypothetical protein
MKRIPLWLFFLTAGLAFSMAAAGADDSFLDKPLPIHAVKFATFEEWAATLRKYSGKTVVLPDGVSAFFEKNPKVGVWFNGGGVRPGALTGPVQIGLNDAKTRLTEGELVFAVEKTHFILKEKKERGKSVDVNAFTQIDGVGKMLATVDAK